jgi:hypothetical protein
MLSILLSLAVAAVVKAVLAQAVIVLAHNL